MSPKLSDEPVVGLKMARMFASESPEPGILMVTREYPWDMRFGIGRSLTPLVDEMKSRGYRVLYLHQGHVTDLRRQARQKILETLVRAPFIQSRSDRMALASAWVERLDMGFLAYQMAQENAYRYVHLHDPWLAIGFWLAMRRHMPCAAARIRWGITEHGFGSYAQAAAVDGLPQGPWARRLLTGLERFVVARSDWVIIPTKIGRDRLLKDLGLDGPPVGWHVIPHARPNLSSMSKLEARRMLGWSQDWIIILAIGRLVSLKRFDAVAKSFIELSRVYQNLHLCVLGAGDDRSWEKTIREQGLGERFMLMCADDVSPYLHAADLYVSASATESFGLANLEALSAGLPVICTNVGAVQEVVGKSALLIKGDLSDLISAIQSLLDSDVKRATLSRAALSHVSSWPTVNVVATRYLDAYGLAYE